PANPAPASTSGFFEAGEDGDGEELEALEPEETSEGLEAALRGRFGSLGWGRFLGMAIEAKKQKGPPAYRRGPYEHRESQQARQAGCMPLFYRSASAVLPRRKPSSLRRVQNHQRSASALIARSPIDSWMLSR
ncbi:MAG TPA: hypothetical protein VN289_19750, partial [Paraburkholderia sp.]|nr:hypothetical protein [Paraburkholderia sp.]